MHNLEFLPEVLLLFITIVAQEYYSEMRDYYRNAWNSNSDTENDTWLRNINRYGLARNYFRYSMFTLMLLLVAIIFDNAWEIFGGTPLHVVSQTLVSLVLIIISYYIYRLVFVGFLIPYPTEEELKQKTGNRKETE